MNEKELASSKHGNVTFTICLILILIGIVLFLIFYLPLRSYGVSSVGIRNMALLSIVPMAVIAGILFWAVSACCLTITDKRVYGKATFAKLVNLPLDSISAVGTGAFNSISVSTSSGRIRFYDIANKAELYEKLSSLLIERQGNEKISDTLEKKQELPKSEADELKKFKDLLDAGIITEEEFNAKKKQLLGL